MNLASLFEQTEKLYGLPSGYLSRTAQIESGGNPNAKNPRSSAGGLFQFIDSTARNYGLTNKFDPIQATDAAGRLARDNANALRGVLGRDPTGGELYLAHQQGSGGAAKLLRNASAPASSVVGSAAIGLNGGRSGMTAGDFANQWINKFGSARGADTLVGGAGADSFQAGGAMADAGPKQSRAVGGLGGLGGFVPPERQKGLDWAGLLSALGDGLIYGDGRAIGASFDARQEQLDKQYEREYGRARDDWMFGIQRQDRMDERADRKDERQLARDWQQQQFQYQQGRDASQDAFRRDQFTYQQGQDETANSRAERTLTLQEQLANRKAEGYRTLTPDEVKQRGLPPGSYQIGPDGKLDEVGKQGQTINVSTGQDEGEFAKKAAGKQVDRLGAISEGGNAAASVVQTLPQLRELLSVAPQGPIQGRLAETFPGFSTAGDAFGAAVNQIAPTLRVAGSGAASDKDIDLLLGSFPRLRNDPAANTIILDAFQTKARINMERADIANAALRGEIKPGEADRRLQELDRQSIIPEGLRQRLGVTKAPDTGLSQNPRNRPRATNPATGKVIEFDGKAWVPVS